MAGYADSTALRCYNAMIVCLICLSSTVCLCVYAVLTAHGTPESRCTIKIVILYIYITQIDLGVF